VDYDILTMVFIFGFTLLVVGVILMNGFVSLFGGLIMLGCGVISNEPEEESDDDFWDPAEYKEPYKIEFIGEGKVRLKKLPRRKVN